MSPEGIVKVYSVPYAVDSIHYVINNMTVLHSVNWHCTGGRGLRRIVVTGTASIDTGGQANPATLSDS